MKLLNIKEISNKLAHKIIGRRKPKSSVSRAIVFEPSLLLLDEPPQV
jgi:ABC-type sugar transport system ATPase subunit